MLTQFDEICQRKDDLEKRCMQRHESPLPALKPRVFYHRDGYNKPYARYAVASAAEKTIDPEKPKATSKTASIKKSHGAAQYFQHSFFVIPKFWCDVMSSETQNFDRIS